MALRLVLSFDHHSGKIEINFGKPNKFNIHILFLKKGNNY